MGTLFKHARMKTTIEISDNLLKKAKRLAKSQNVTLRSLAEEGLRQVIEERSARRKTKLKPVTFKGNGLSPEFRGEDWKAIRDAVYQGRGA
jgi:hypothetical protein